MFRSDQTGFYFFSAHIHWYGLLIVAGMLLGTLQGCLRENKLGLPKGTTIDVVLVGVPAALLGARLYYVVFSLDEYIGRPLWKIFAIWEGGLAIYGGLLAALLAGALYGRKKKIFFLKLADLAAPGFAIGQAIGRWGNYLNHEAFGRVTERPWLCFFPASVMIDGTWHYATFFYESCWCMLIAAALLLLEKKRKLPTGHCFFCYAFLYALERGIVEGLRTDSLYLGQIRISQLLSWTVALIVAILWIVRRKKWDLKALALVAMIALSAVMSLAGQLGYAILSSVLALCMAAYTYAKE